MGVYRTLWIGAAGLAGAAGVWASVRAWSVGSVLFLFLFLIVGVACILLLTTKEGEPLQWRRAARAGLVTSAVTVSAGGLVAWLGIPALFVVAMLAVLSPPVLVTVRQHYRSGRDTPPPEDRDRPALPFGDHAFSSATPRVPAGSARPRVPAGSASVLESAWMNRPTATMDNATLCLAWRTSFVALQQPLPPSTKLRVVERRQEFLDEFERRNARGFAAWLASGARAAGDPSRFITDLQRRKHRHDQR